MSPVIYSWSYHHDEAMRRLKRDITALCLWHPDGADGHQEPGVGPVRLDDDLAVPAVAGAGGAAEATRRYESGGEFSALITGIGARYATREDAASFVKEAMEALEPWYLAEEAAEDRDLGGGGHRAMLAAHRKLRWFGCFRYTVGKPAFPPHWREPRDDQIHIQNVARQSG